MSPRGHPPAPTRPVRTARARRRIAVQAYAPTAPTTAGSGYAWPFRDYADVEPRPLRETYQWWQAIARDVADRRRARRWEQSQVADAAGVALNTVQRIERGEWTAVHNLFVVCSVLALRIEQTVDVADPRPPTPADREARRRMARPAAHDRVATYAEVLAGRTVLTALARHHELAEPRVDLDGTFYVRAARVDDFGPLWRFSTVLAQTVGVWVKVSADEGRPTDRKRCRCDQRTVGSWRKVGNHFTANPRAGRDTPAQTNTTCRYDRQNGLASPQVREVKQRRLRRQPEASCQASPSEGPACWCLGRHSSLSLPSGGAQPQHSEESS